MRQTNKLNLASNSSNEHKRLSSVTLGIFLVSIQQVSLRSWSGLTNEILIASLTSIVTLRARTHYLELLYAETAALGRADAFLLVARAPSVGAETHQLEIVRSSTERWSKLARIQTG